MKLNFITNPNPKLQEKMRFFADHFLFVNEYLGRLPEVPFDNPYSLLDKIIFQIENNFKRSYIYLPNYFNQFFSFYNQLTNRKEILKIEGLYKQYLLESNKNLWIQNNPSFLIEIKKLHEDYQNTLFDDNFSSLFSFLKCPHALKKHEKEIKYCIQILVSQFRFNGYSKNHINSSIDRILSSDKFPFPPEIIEIKENDERDKAEKEFLEKRSFKDQFYGLKHLLIRPKFQSGNFIYCIENCSLSEELNNTFNVRFDKVTFVSPQHESVKELKKDFKEKSDRFIYKTNKDFFSNNNLLAYVNLNYDAIDYAKEDGLKIVEQELQQFNKHIETELQVNITDYLFSENLLIISNGSISLSEQNSRQIESKDLRYLEKNVHEVLRNNSSKAKLQILHNENVFFKTLSTNEISSYWQYIENICWASNIISFPKVRDNFSKVLLNQVNALQREFLSQINLMVFPFGIDYKELGLDDSDIFIPLSGVLKKMNPDFNIISLEKKIKNYFLKEVIKYYKNFNSREQNKKWIEYFKSLLIELYDYRNAELHSGTVNEFTKIKLQTVMPSLISYVRWQIIYSCKANPNLDFEELINLLITKATAEED